MMQGSTTKEKKRPQPEHLRLHESSKRGPCSKRILVVAQNGIRRRREGANAEQRVTRERERERERKGTTGSCFYISSLFVFQKVPYPHEKVKKEVERTLALSSFSPCTAFIQKYLISQSSNALL